MPQILHTPEYPELAPPDSAEPPFYLGQQAIHAQRTRDEYWATGLTFLGEKASVSAEVAFTLGNEEDNRLKRVLGAMRTGFAELTPPQQMKVGAYLTRLVSASPGLSPEAAQPRLLAHRTDVDDSQLLELARRHQATIERQSNSPEAAEAVRQEKEERLRMEEQGITDDWISLYARKSADKVRDAKVNVVDVAKAAHGYAGYHFPGTDWLAITQGEDVGAAGVDLFVERIHDVAGHELAHLQFYAQGRPTWEEEALAEHLDLGLRTGGDLAAMDPGARKQQGLLERGRLVEERRLKFIELTAGFPVVDATSMLRYAILAYTSGDMNSLESQISDDLIDRSWGRKNMRGHIGTMVVGYETALTKGMERDIEMSLRLGSSQAEIDAKRQTPRQLRDEALRRTQMDLLAESRTLRAQKTQHLKSAVLAGPGPGDSGVAA